MDLYSPILQLYWKDFLDVFNNNMDSVQFKSKIVKSVKNSIINENAVLSFLNDIPLITFLIIFFELSLS